MITRRNFLRAEGMGLATLALVGNETVLARTGSFFQQTCYVSNLLKAMTSNNDTEISYSIKTIK